MYIHYNHTYASQIRPLCETTDAVAQHMLLSLPDVRRCQRYNDHTLTKRTAGTSVVFVVRSSQRHQS